MGEGQRRRSALPVRRRFLNCKRPLATEQAQGHPEFSVNDIVEAAESPETPREGVEPAAWQRWGKYLYDTILPPGQPGGILSSERGSTSAAPTLRGGAEGLTPERYRTSSGGWTIPRRDIPPVELELKDFIGQMRGIQLEGEELAGELAAVVSQKETGQRGLQNNISGVSLQRMAEAAQEQGFIATADKESLLEALARSVTQGQPVYSVYATGRIPLIDDPHVSAAYQAVLDAVATMKGRTAEQVAGVRHRPGVHAEGAALLEEGQFTRG